MKKKIRTLAFSAMIFLGLIFNFSTAFCQFEQKLTISGSATILYPDMLEEYSSYGNGFGFDGGVQYNFDRNFSFYGAARFYYMFGGASYEDAYYDNLAIGGGLKYNILPTKRINPYLFGEANVNFIWLEEYLYETQTYDSDNGVSIGGMGGVGFDVVINDNLGVFVQSGAYYTLWDGRMSLYSQLGVRINMIKSKTI